MDKVMMPQEKIGLSMVFSSGGQHYVVEEKKGMKKEKSVLNDT